MIYVLIIVALFAALSLTLARQTDTSETGTLSAYEVDILASQILQSSGAVKQAIDQMLYYGVEIDDLDFVEIGDEPAFSTEPHGDKVFHPLGGGLLLQQLPDNVFAEVGALPSAGVYLGRFNNVEWTPSASDEVIFTINEIDRSICEKVNQNLTGSNNIPVLTVAAADVLVFKSGGNTDFTIAHCQDSDSPANDVDCEGKPSLCVQDSTGAWSFFSLIATQ